MTIEYLRPLDASYRHMKWVLFRNFRFEKWLVMGFSAWIAGVSSFGNVRASFGDASPVTSVSEARSFAADQPMWVWGGLLVAILTVAAVLIVLSWVRSRGQFVFVDNVVSNVGRIRRPWAEYRSEGNSLFFGKLGLVVIQLGLGLLCGLVGFFGLKMGLESALSVTLIAVPIAVFVLGSLALALALFFTDSFVVPIMFAERTSFRVAWRRFSTVLVNHLGHFVLYILFTVVLAIAIGLLTFAGILLTCCALALVLAVPYVGTVVLLPLFVVWRAFSIFYLQQMIPGLELIASPDPVAPSAESPSLGTPSA